MKKNRIGLYVFLLGILFVSCTRLDSNNLPSSARSFLDKYFHDVEIMSLEQDVDNDYNVYLENGIEINFERKGNWTEIKAKKRPLPESLLEILPKQLSNYVQTNYPGQSIRKIEKKAYGYRISLNKPNNVELKFTRRGVFLSEDQN
jgi:hypothetical protein